MNLVAKEAARFASRAGALRDRRRRRTAGRRFADRRRRRRGRHVRDARARPRDGAEERAARIRRLRAIVRGEDLEWWLARQLRDLAAVAGGGRPPSRALRDTVRRLQPGVARSAVSPVRASQRGRRPRHSPRQRPKDHRVQTNGHCNVVCAGRNLSKAADQLSATLPAYGARIQPPPERGDYEPRKGPESPTRSRRAWQARRTHRPHDHRQDAGHLGVLTRLP